MRDGGRKGGGMRCGRRTNSNEEDREEARALNVAGPKNIDT